LGTLLSIFGIEAAMHTVVLAVCIFGSVFCLTAEAMLWATDEQGRHRRRLKKRLSHLKELGISNNQETVLKNAASGLSFFLLDHIPRLEKLERSLVQADLRINLEAFLGLVFLSGTIAMGAGLLKFGLVGGLVGAGLGMWLPFEFLALKKSHRIAKFERQLPDALDLLARGLKSGHAFVSGLQLVADEMGPPIGPEFFRTFKEHNHGLDLNTALLNLCQRIDLADLRFFTTAVMIQRETGGNLAEILEKISALIRERFELHNQVKALTAEGRLSGIVLVLLPPATALAFLFINRDYIMQLWLTPKGRMMAMIALFLQTLGILTIRKIVKIKI
jgi:tight adherence protein B